jgi:hemerythrin
MLMALMQAHDLPDLAFPEIDAEHHEVVRLLNRLYEASTSKSASTVIQAALDELISFTRLHFQDEEHVMAVTDYPAREEHKVQHEALLAMLLAFQSSTDAGDPISNIAMLELLKGWLCNHVPSEDTKLAAWFRSRHNPHPAWNFR